MCIYKTIYKSHKKLLIKNSYYKYQVSFNLSSNVSYINILNISSYFTKQPQHYRKSRGFKCILIICHLNMFVKIKRAIFFALLVVLKLYFFEYFSIYLQK